MLKFGRQKVPDTSDAGGRGARSGARTSDPNDDLKRKARQRLIGAVILVLTAIIVVPMLLDSEPRPLGQDIAISIPPKDAPFNGDAPAAGAAPGTPAAGAAANAPAGTAPVAPTNAPANPAANPPAPTGAAAPSAPAGSSTVAPVAVAPVATAPLTETPKPAEAPKPEAAKPATKPEPAKTEAKPEAAKPVAAPKEADGDKALALLEGKPTVKTVANGKFIVQVGAFASEEKVKELQARLKTAGLSTYTEKVKTDAGERIRLRAGPFGTRADADSVLGKIKAAGINGAVIVQ
jgi:DedD protein